MSHIELPRRPLWVAVSLLVSIILVACRAGGGFPSSAPSAHASSPGASASVEATASPSENLGPFACNLPVAAAATTDRAQITDVRVDTHDGYDRIVIEFASGLPEYTISAASPPFTHDPSGLPLNVAGSAILSIVMHDGTKVTPDGTLTYSGPTDFTPNLSKVVELVEAGDFEAVSSWYIGLASVSCIRVLTLSDPSRLVIDIEH